MGYSPQLFSETAVRLKKKQGSLVRKDTLPYVRVSSKQGRHGCLSGQPCVCIKPEEVSQTVQRKQGPGGILKGTQPPFAKPPQKASLLTLTLSAYPLLPSLEEETIETKEQK